MSHQHIASGIARVAEGLRLLSQSPEPSPWSRSQVEHWEHEYYFNNKPVPPEVKVAALDEWRRRGASDLLIRTRSLGKNSELDQLIYQWVAVHLGYKRTRTLMFLLAKRAPIQELRDYVADRSDRVPSESLALLYVANMIPKSKEWQPSEAGVKAYYHDRVLPKTTWDAVGGISGQRIVEALAEWVAKWGGRESEWLDSGDLSFVPEEIRSHWFNWDGWIEVMMRYRKEIG